LSDNDKCDSEVSDGSNSSDEFSENQDLDCEILECSETNNDDDLPAQPSTSAVSLLSVLKTPRLSILARKRKVAVNPPPKGKRSSSGKTSKDSVKVKPDVRVRQYPEEHFIVSNGKLFCEACREQLNVKRSSINNDVQSAKHKEGKSRLQRKEQRDQTIVQALQKYNETHHTRGETLPLEHKAYRVKVVRTFLCAAVPMNKLDKFCNLLEESAFSLSDRCFMSDHIPFILKEEEELIRKEFADKYVSVTFDG